MTARAQVLDNFPYDGIDIYLGLKTDSGTVLVRPTGDGGANLEAVPEAVVASAPSLRLRHDLARALLDALAAHYGGAADTRALRRDYDAERARVDRLIGHLTSDGGRSDG